MLNFCSESQENSFWSKISLATFKPTINVIWKTYGEKT